MANDPPRVVFETLNSCVIFSVSKIEKISVIFPLEIPPEFSPVSTQLSNDSISLTFLIPGFHYLVETNRDYLRIVPPTSRSCEKIPLHIQRLLVRPEHAGKEPLISAAFSPNSSIGEYLFTDCSDPNFWLHLYSLGFFTLPSECGIIGIPNPSEKFCVQLVQAPLWKWAKKMRKNTYNFVVDCVATVGVDGLKNSMENILTKISFHHDSTWINDIFIRNTVKLISSDCPVQYFVFKLFDRDELVAVSVGYKYKNSFMDFTAATFRRTPDSPGKILMFKEGDFLLENLNVKLWYLGFKLPYMSNLVTDDSARNFSREQFQKLWNS